MIPRHHLAVQLTTYLTHELSMDQLKDWAVRAMRDEDFELQDVELLSDIVSGIGLADTEPFGLTWEGHESFLSRLGYQVRLRVSPTT